MIKYSPVRIDADINSKYKKEAKKRGLTKEELINQGLEYYLNVGIDIDDQIGKSDIRKALSDITKELDKLRGAFFSYFKVHEKGYSMGTLKMLWEMIGYLKVLERNTYFPVKDQVLTEDNFNQFVTQNEQLKNAHKNTNVPEEFYKGNL